MQIYFLKKIFFYFLKILGIFMYGEVIHIILVTYYVTSKMLITNIIYIYTIFCKLYLTYTN